MTWKWYLSIAAVRQYMEIAGLSGPLEDDNPGFLLAQEVLGELSLTAKLVDTKEPRSGGSYYRGKIDLHGRRRRVEMVVMPPIRSEGPLPQLVRITLK